MYRLTAYEREQFNRHVERCEKSGLKDVQKWFENNREEAANWFWNCFAAENIPLWEAQDRYKCIVEHGIEF